MLNRRIHAEWLYLGIILAVLALLPFVSNTDPDFWWHLRTGDLIAHSGIPRHDPYSWTASGRPWVAHEWLSELLIYEVQHWLGYAADVALFSLATVASLALVYALARRRGASVGLLLGLVVLSSINLALFITVRPQVFTWLLFAVFVVIIDRAEHDEAAPVWLLPPLMAVWVNLHLGFAYGLMLVALWCVARGIGRVRGQAVDLRTPVVVTSLCFVAAMLNPIGPTIFAYPLRYVQDRQSLSVASEWDRPDPTFAPLWPYFLSVGLILVSLVSKHRPRPFLVLTALLAVASSLEAARSIPFAALALPAAAGPALTGMLNQSSRTGRSRGQRRRDRSAPAQRKEDERPLTLPVSAAAAIVLPILGAGMLLIAVTPDGIPLRAPRDRSFPSAGAAYIAEQLPNARLFNEYTWGGYLIYREHSMPVFIDGRSDFYRAQILDDYSVINQADDGWEDIVVRYQIDTILIPKQTRLAVILRRRSNWQEVFTGDVESVFVMRPSRS